MPLVVKPKLTPELLCQFERIVRRLVNHRLPAAERDVESRPRQRCRLADDPEHGFAWQRRLHHLVNRAELTRDVATAAENHAGHWRGEYALRVHRQASRHLLLQEGHAFHGLSDQVKNFCHVNAPSE
jgi:hypothetical protein